jgi:signal transduction histidine kinase
MYRRSALEMRVLILAPIGRDAALLSETLKVQRIDTAIADNAMALLEMLAEGAGASIVAEEALNLEVIQALHAWLEVQPNWSDPPFIILIAASNRTVEDEDRLHQLRTLGNFTLVERPLRPETVQSAARAALRARGRQYEIRSRQESLLQANADLEQFAYSASHDLREPLRSIGIYSDLLRREYDSVLDERGREFLSVIRSGATRMDALLTDLLAYAHASSISEDDVEQVSATKPLQAALESLAGAIRESGAEIIVNDLPSVRMHSSHLSQIFQNLVGNSIKYRKDDARLVIQVSAVIADQEPRWTFSVSDNGIGIPPAYKETIFGIFKRLHANSKYAGTGMGLAICQRIVERYRGRIWVESEPGTGSTFYFTVPA